MLFIAGCDLGNDGIKNSIDKKPENVENERFPLEYRKVIGRVNFECNLEIPENNSNRINNVQVNGYKTVDKDKAYREFVDGKDVIETYSIPTDVESVTDDTYVFSDKSEVSIGNDFSYSSFDNVYYAQIGVMNLADQLSDEVVSIGEPEQYVEALKQTLGKIGFSIEDIQFKCYPISASTLQKVEEESVKNGVIEKEKCKRLWTENDDIYVVSGSQQVEKIPINHEMMNIHRALAYDTADNGQIIAVYSGRGLESLLQSLTYNLNIIDSEIHLKNFDEIAGVVAEKFNNVLNEANYTVKRAKLFERVHWAQNQKLEAEPIWYFEVIENDTTKTVVLVNAETGKEIYLN